MLISPINGKVSLGLFWSETQNIKAGDRVLTVIPFAKTEYLTQLYIPMQGAGKIKKGNKINIKFDHYPYMEFGMVEAQIVNISALPEKEFYVATAKLPNGLLSTYNKELHFSQQMTGTADIITEDIRLLMRFINPIRSLLKSNV